MMDERTLAEAAGLVDVIADAEERLLRLRGWTRSTDGTWLDTSGGSAPYTRGRALAIVTREVRDAVAELAGRAA